MSTDHDREQAVEWLMAHIERASDTLGLETPKAQATFVFDVADAARDMATRILKENVNE